MTKKKDLEIVLSDQVKGKMADDPELAAMLQEMFAAFHQAQHGVETGQYKSFDDAMEAITGSRPEPVEFDEDEAPKPARKRRPQ